MKKILVIGATGQIGTELTPALRRIYGKENVVAGIHKHPPGQSFLDAGPHLTLDVRDRKSIRAGIKAHSIDTIFHLAAMLSARAEAQPWLAWEVNMDGLLNVLHVALEYECRVFFPSSIGAFGPSTPADNTPQLTIQRPNTMYGITKTAGELLCDYYNLHFGLDTRGVRYPGLISYLAPPGGGTTDYAVEIFYAALQKKRYTCPLKPTTSLDMMYMPDAIQAAIQIMTADPVKLEFRNAYNVTAMSFTPEGLCCEITKHIPDFSMNYEINPVLQAIADSWPNRMDDSAAREQWGWQPQYDLSAMTVDMIARLSEKFADRGHQGRASMV